MLINSVVPDFIEFVIWTNIMPVFDEKTVGVLGAQAQEKIISYHEGFNLFFMFFIVKTCPVLKR